ncbi:MAG: hypothetical protein Q8L23_03330 [Caulobacter sp.]|nr:hypothetical protein [Caulobacter sp.]
MSQPPAERLNAADVAAMLDRFGGHDLMARGAVNIISLAAIREVAGDRWPRKRPDVWAYMERKLAEHLTYQDMAQRVGETDYLIAMTSEDGVAAQAVALKVLEEVLMHFLGAAEPRDMAVRAVTDLKDGEVSCAPLDPVFILQARARAEAEPPTPAVRPVVDPFELRKRNPFSFHAAAGTPLRVDFAVEDVQSLKHGVTAALRIEPTVTEVLTGRTVPARAFGKLSDIDLLTIDQATLEFAALFLPRVDGQGQPALIVPVSFRTMSTSKGRQLLINCSGAAPGRVKASVMLELVDIDRGAPLSRLIEVLGLLKSVCRGVFARVQPGKDAMASLKGVRLGGMTLDAADLPGPDSRIAVQILEFGRQARGLAPALAVQGLSNDGFFAVAETAGLTHASVRVAAMTAEQQPAA